VKPIIHETFPLARAADAHRMMEGSSHIGKLILIV
jgi:NADPH:quinone reductase-like Zn-dependent oxidoreductase